MSTCLGENLWAIFILESHYTKDVTIKNVKHSYGKFCDGGLQHCKEIQASDIDGKTIGPKKSYSIYTAGRQGSPSGTTGSFDLYADNDKIVTVSWDCPWIGSNEVKLGDVPTDWIVSNTPYSSSGAIGTVIIKFSHMEK